MCFDFQYHFVWNISHSKKKWVKYDKKSVYWSSLTGYCRLSDFNETWIFSTVSEKYWNIKFYKIKSSGSRVFPCGRNDGWTWRSLETLFAILGKAAIHSNNPLVIHNLCSWNKFVCAAESSWFFTVTGLWYWVDNLCKCWYWRGFV
jgi:hypothetical protein